MFAAVLCSILPAFAQADQFDVVLANGRVMDPASGLDAVRDIGIEDGRIARISESPLSGEVLVDVSGLVVAPGFIDLHAHGHGDDAYRLHVMDGVTTALEMELGVYPVAEWYSSRAGSARINFGASVGHAAARATVLAGGSREPGDQVQGSPEEWVRTNIWSHKGASAGELQRILAHIEHGLDEGALAIGMVLAYTPGARRSEVFRVFQLAKQYDVPVFAHARYDSGIEPDSVDAVQELIANSASVGVPVHIAHINSTGRALQPVLLELIEGAASNGVDVTTEAYPYTATSTFIGAAMFDNGFRERLGISYSDVVWTATGERLTDRSFSRLRESNPAGLVVVHAMTDELVGQAIGNPRVLIASDGMAWRTGNEHPRGAGTFSRVLGRYVRQRGALSLMDALAKMTSMPARRLESAVPAMKRKGRIIAGADADIVVFDPQRIIDRATFESPMEPSEGIGHVLVNGAFVVRDYRLVDDVFPGRAVRRSVSVLE